VTDGGKTQVGGNGSGVGILVNAAESRQGTSTDSLSALTEKIRTKKTSTDPVLQGQISEQTVCAAQRMEDQQKKFALARACGHGRQRKTTPEPAPSKQQPSSQAKSKKNER
jgi:hypothetical protein